ncbi:MAG: hypothetical protein OYH76_14860 [Defluviicoccus sp.]|nr:hypothetical protein [Defluviicoccus sp.]MDE0277172.1 hypothetical protein [Defluviicoccus sp.]
MIADLAGFIGLAALMVALFAWMRLDMGRMEERIADRFERLEARVTAIEVRLAAVEHGQARLEGLLEGLREAIAVRAAAQ